MAISKKIIAAIMTAAIATSAVAVSASAVSDTTDPVSTSYGDMVGKLTVTSTSTKKYVIGRTTCTGTAPRIFVTIDVVSYPSGKDIYSDSDPVEATNSKSVSSSAYSYSTAAISAYGAHEVRGTSSWGEYTTLVNA